MHWNKTGAGCSTGLCMVSRVASSTGTAYSPTTLVMLRHVLPYILSESPFAMAGASLVHAGHDGAAVLLSAEGRMLPLRTA